MDYFAKFRKRISPPKSQPTSAMRLAKFHKCWDYVHNIFIAEDRKLNLHVKQTEIPEKLREMVDMLVDEEARQEDNTTDVCMEYFLKHGVLQYLVNQSEKMDYPEGIRGESIRMIASMVDLLDDRFLVHNAVHRPTIKLLRFCVLDVRQSEVDHEDLVDLMYIICSKIHGLPDLLNIFFHDKQWLTHPQKTLKSIHQIHPTISLLSQQQSSSPPEYEFLLFTYLLRFVHREGRAGDFARTGLLFLMEMATDQLGDFILDSDFATVMAASLGALFSQLPSKLIIKDEHEINSTPASFLLGQDLDPKAYPMDEFGIEQSNSGQFQYQLDSFLKLLEFCQDVLLRCPNHAISDRLLLCIRKSFLENVLYPSIVECSDYDGSSVAVISYLDLILQVVQQKNLANVIVGFLMDHYDDEQPCEDVVNELMLSKPDSRENLPQSQKQDQNPYFTRTSERFTLKDLIISRLKSTSQVTVIATLKLLKTLITKHCNFADRLLSTEPDEIDQNPPPTIISHHIREIELYFHLVTAIDGAHADEILNLGYEDYLKDVESIMDVDPCYQDFLQSPYHEHKQREKEQKEREQKQKSERRRSFKYGQKKELKTRDIEEAYDNHKPKTRQRIKSTDTLIPILLGLLSHFFAQSSELNLALTGVISALAMCPYRSLEGWISFSKHDRTSASDIIHLTGDTMYQQQSNKMMEEDDLQEEQDIEDDQSMDYGVEKNSVHMTTPTQFKSFPPFYTIFRTLTQQVDYYRSEVDDFDNLLDERWNGLLFGEPTTSNMANMGIQPISSSSTHTLRRGSNATSIFNSQGMMKPSTSSTLSNTNHSTANGSGITASVVSQGVSKFFGLGASASSSSTHKRRNSVVSMKTSISSSTLNTNNPAKSMPSSTSQQQLQQQQQQQQLLQSQTAPLSNAIIPVINPLSPLAMHAKKTMSIRIQPLFPSNFETDRDEPILDLDEEDQDVFAPQQNPSQRKRKSKSTEISLSMLLNNVVILEETIKELVAILQVRRSIGIDKIRYT